MVAILLQKLTNKMCNTIASLPLTALLHLYNRYKQAKNRQIAISSHHQMESLLKGSSKT